MKRSRVNTAELIRRQIEERGEGYWRHSDFSHLPSTAVSKALSRLAADGVLERISKGLYYRPRRALQTLLVPFYGSIALPSGLIRRWRLAIG